MGYSAWDHKRSDATEQLSKALGSLRIKCCLSKISQSLKKEHGNSSLTFSSF